MFAVEKSSYVDPNGYVFRADQGLFRAIRPSAEPFYRDFLGKGGKVYLFHSPDKLVEFVKSGAEHDLSQIDTWPTLVKRVTTRDIMDEVLADYVAASSPISPAIQGRVACTTTGATACPIVTP